MVQAPPPAKFINRCVCHISIGFESMLWQVPVTIATRTNPAAITFVLNRASAIVSVEGVEADEWVLVSVTCGNYHTHLDICCFI